MKRIILFLLIIFTFSSCISTHYIVYGGTNETEVLVSYKKRNKFQRHSWLEIVITPFLYPGFYYYEDGKYFYHQRMLYRIK